MRYEIILPCTQGQNVPDQHMTDQHAADQHLTDRHIADQHIAGQHVPDQHVVDQLIADQNAPGQILPSRNLPSQNLPGLNVHPCSGPTNDLPWSQDTEFLKKAGENGTTVLLGAYRTVLRDPLPGEEYNVHLAARMLAGRVVAPGAVFSQNGAIGPYTSDRGFREGPTYAGTTLIKTIGGGVCKIASTLYNVTVLSNLEIVERHAHTMPVPYVPYGQDATVSYGNKDFKFRNNTASPLMVWAQGIDNVLYIAFYGKTPAPGIEWKHEVLETRKAPRLYRKNPDLGDGQEKLVLEGMDGAVVKSWVQVKGQDGTVVRYMGVSYYQPMPYIIEKAR